MESDAYAVIGVSDQADSDQIRTAYRKASLRVHPDRNPGDPDAAIKFHALNSALETLLDPVKRAQVDARRAAQLASQARFHRLDSKRKALARDLQEREAALLSQHQDDHQRLAKAQKLHHIQAAGLKLRQAKHDAMRAAQASHSATSLQPSSSIDLSDNTHPLLDPLHSTLRFKWSKKKFPNLVDSDTLSSFIISSGLVGPLDIDSILISSKDRQADNSPPNDHLPLPPPSKKLSAVVCFKDVALSQRFLDFAKADPAWSNCTVSRIQSS